MNKLWLLVSLFVLTACKNYPDKQELPEGLSKTEMELGASVYQDFCVQCHLDQGQGVPMTFPPLAGSEWLTEKRTAGIHAVKYGQKGPITVIGESYNGIMPPMGLTDQEVAAVMNYIMNSWGNRSSKTVTVEEVAAVNK